MEPAVTTVSPRDHVGREVVDLSGDTLAEEIAPERQQVIEDLQVVRRVRDVLGDEDTQQIAVRITHRERGGRPELQAGRLETHGVHTRPIGGPDPRAPRPVLERAPWGHPRVLADARTSG